MKISFYLFAVAILFACKKPLSDFQLKKYEYSQGNALEYENFSENAKSSLWTIYNSAGDTVQTFEGAHPNIVAKIMAPDGTYTLELTAFKKNDKKFSLSEKQFLLKSEMRFMSINYVNGNYVGKEI